MINLVQVEKTKGYLRHAITRGFPRARNEAWAAMQTPPVTPEELNAAYAAVVEDWSAAANASDSEIYALHLGRREELYRMAMESGDIPLAHKILQDLGKLQQQYRSEQRRAETATKADDIVSRIKARSAPTLATVGGKRHG